MHLHCALLSAFSALNNGHMDAVSLAQKLRKLHFKDAKLLEWRPGLPPLERHTIANASVYIDTRVKGGFTSSNRNRVQFWR